MVEVETQPIRIDQRARLMHLVTEHVAQRVVQDVSRGVIAHRGIAALAIDLEMDFAAQKVAKTTPQKCADVRSGTLRPYGVRYFKERPGLSFYNSSVTDLT